MIHEISLGATPIFCFVVGELSFYWVQALLTEHGWIALDGFHVYGWAICSDHSGVPRTSYQYFRQVLMKGVRAPGMRKTGLNKDNLPLVMRIVFNS